MGESSGSVDPSQLQNMSEEEQLRLAISASMQSSEVDKEEEEVEDEPAEDDPAAVKLQIR